MITLSIYFKDPTVNIANFAIRMKEFYNWDAKTKLYKGTGPDRTETGIVMLAPTNIRTAMANLEGILDMDDDIASLVIEN